MFPNSKILSKKAYLIGVSVIFVAVYSQYFFDFGAVLGFIVVYGIPIAIVSFILSREIFKNANRDSISAIKVGLGSFGVFTLVGFLLSFLALLIMQSLDPQTINLLSKPNPVLQVPHEIAWIMVAVSILVVGPSEEFLFRGFVYGGLLNIFKGRHWLSLAVISSLLFASVHAYYAITYGIAATIPFIDLITFGMAMATTFYLSKGNLVAPALIHGVYDATAYLDVATSMNIGLILRFALIIIGLVLAVTYISNRNRISKINGNE